MEEIRVEGVAETATVNRSKATRQTAAGRRRKRRKVVSAKQLAANRTNSLRSTGPRTPEGKTASRWNALKHGLLARHAVIQSGLGTERMEEFRTLHNQLRDDLHPDGTLEEILVEKIAVCYWRMRRVLRSEVGELRRGLDIVPEKARSRREILKILSHKLDGEQMLGDDYAGEPRWIDEEMERRYLPQGKAADLILRYETAIERQLYRALNQLERVQRRKEGDAVPPPVSVDFAGM